MAKAIDLTNQKFGKLTVLERDYSIKREGAYWKCKCDCGNIISAQGKRLRSGATKSCGCLVKEKAIETHTKDLLGQKFGKLLVLEKDNSEFYKNKVGAYWICQCDCGKIKTIKGSDLRRGNTQSCGCLKSGGELKIRQILQKLSINFIEQKTFDNLRGRERFLSFDFYLPDKQICIEFQGKQHYQPIEYFGGNKQFTTQQYYDQLKKDYCLNNNIKLIEIPYYNLQDIDENYIKQILQEEYNELSSQI